MPANVPPPTAADVAPAGDRPARPGQPARSAATRPPPFGSCRSPRRPSRTPAPACAGSGCRHAGPGRRARAGPASSRTPTQPIMDALRDYIGSPRLARIDRAQDRPHGGRGVLFGARLRADLRDAATARPSTAKQAMRLPAQCRRRRHGPGRISGAVDHRGRAAPPNSPKPKSASPSRCSTMRAMPRPAACTIRASPPTSCTNWSRRSRSTC